MDAESTLSQRGGPQQDAHTAPPNDIVRQEGAESVGFLTELEERLETKLTAEDVRAAPAYLKALSHAVEIAIELVLTAIILSVLIEFSNARPGCGTDVDKATCVRFAGVSDLTALGVDADVCSEQRYQCFAFLNAAEANDVYLNSSEDTSLTIEYCRCLTATDIRTPYEQGTRDCTRFWSLIVIFTLGIIYIAGLNFVNLTVSQATLVTWTVLFTLYGGVAMAVLFFTSCSAKLSSQEWVGAYTVMLLFVVGIIVLFTANVFRSARGAAILFPIWRQTSRKEMKMNSAFQREATSREFAQSTAALHGAESSASSVAVAVEMQQADSSQASPPPPQQ